MAATKPHYHISAGLHSAETSPPEAVIELVYRLAVSEEPYIRKIRDNLIVSVTPTTDLDGRDRAVDWYNAYKVDEAYDGGENYGGPPYWGKYVFHDNNRDINYGVDSLRAHLEWYLHWVPPVWHDLHEAQVLLYTFSGQPPQNANLDPILYSELPFFATYEVNKLTGYGMPGVWHFGFVDMWSPGYLGFAAANHNGMLRMYEIFNQGGANTKKARLSGNQLTREWYRPKPAPAGEVDWSIRNSINYAQTGVLTALELASTVPAMLVENFYRKSANSVAAGSAAAPYAYVLPSGQADQTRVDRVVNLLRRQAIEVHRATAEVGSDEAKIAAGSYLVRLNQPYGRLARTLLEKQTYPDANLRTYDDSAWTMGLANDLDIRAVDDVAVLTSPAELLTADVVTVGSLQGSGSVVAVKHTGALSLITLRYRLKDLPVRGASAAFATPAGEFPPGSFLIEAGSQAERIATEVKALGLVGRRPPGACRKAWRRPTWTCPGSRSTRPGRTPRRSAGCAWPSIDSRFPSTSSTRTTSSPGRGCGRSTTSSSSRTRPRAARPWSSSSRSCRSRCPTGSTRSSSRWGCTPRPTTCAAAWASRAWPSSPTSSTRAGC